MTHSTEALLGERNDTHGDFRYQFRVAQDLKEVCRHTDTYWDMDCVLRESIDMMLLKLSRILTGQPLFEDHWADILGYGALAQKRVQELQKSIDMSWVDAASPPPLMARVMSDEDLTDIIDDYIENEPEND